MTNDSRVTFSSNKKAYFINYHLSSTSAFFLFLTSVSDMSSRDKHVSCCIPTSYKYNYSCGYCCSVFISSEEKTKHNLLHFNPCPMCRLTLRSRDSLMRHMHTDHNQPLASIKRHTTQCKTYKLPVIPERLSKVKMAEEVEKVSRLETVKEVKVVEEVHRNALPIFRRFQNEVAFFVKTEMGISIRNALHHFYPLSGSLSPCEGQFQLTEPLQSLEPLSQGPSPSRLLIGCFLSQYLKDFFCLQVASSTTEEPTPPTSPGLEVADSPTWARCVIFEGITFHIFNDLSQKLIVQGRCFLNPHFSLYAGSREKASCTPAKAFANLQYLWSLQPWVSCFQMLLCLDNVSHILTDNRQLERV